MNVIELNNVSVYYHNYHALENINLTIEDKQFVAIIGPNGAGKSTLFKVILGLIKPDRGEVKLFGKNSDRSQLAGQLGYVPQTASFNLKFPVNVLDVVLMGRLKRPLTLFHRYNVHDRKEAENLLTRLGLKPYLERQIGQLSGGQLQKVLIARALISGPEILILDEPTSSIDMDSRNQIFALLKELNKELTILVATHDLAAVSSFFDSIACLNKKLHYHGDKELTGELVKRVFGCPIDLITHGTIPHRILKDYQEEKYD